MIIEGVHLVPSLYKNLKLFRKFHFVFILKSLSKHRANIKNKISRRHGRQKDEWTEKEKDLQRIQDYLILDARKLKTSYIFESSNPKKNSQEIIKILEKTLK